MPARTGRRWREHTVPRVLRRDKGICHLCDQPGADTADHVIPAAHGGTDHLDNLKAAHHDPCNRLRGDRSIAWARAEIAKRRGDTPDAGWTW